MGVQSLRTLATLVATSIHSSSPSLPKAMKEVEASNFDMLRVM